MHQNQGEELQGNQLSSAADIRHDDLADYPPRRYSFLFTSIDRTIRLLAANQECPAAAAVFEPPIELESL